MHYLKKSSRAAALLIFGFWITLITGCVNLEAVRDFSANSAKLTGYKTVTELYLSGPDRELNDIRNATDPEDKEKYEKLRKKVEAKKPIVAQQRDTLMSLHAVTTGYMTALATLAGDKAFNLSDNIKNVSSAINEIPSLGVKSEHVTAYASIIGKISDAATSAIQARDVKKIVLTYGDSMNKLLEAMQTIARSYSGTLGIEQLQFEAAEEFRLADWQEKSPNEDNATKGRRALIVTLAERSSSVILKSKNDAVNAALQAEAGLVIVKEGHDALIKNIDRLDEKQLKAQLEKAAKDLQDIRDNLQKL